MRNFVVAIDGPAGSGKSSISTIVSQRTGFTHVDTGAMFRAVTLYALENNIKLDDENAYGFLDDLKLIFKNDHTYLNGRDVSNEIRTDIITNNVSTVAKIARVREKMIEYERESAKEGLILMDGRDIGTVVLPNADLKVFLTASKEERAKRRLKENLERGIETTYEQVLEDIIARDYKDSHRAIAPLRCPEDAIVLDTTDLTIEQVVEKLIELIDRGMGNGRI
ncbi:MAG: (d)CMP kinase [Acholeplasmatales bacterium]|nr:(d)CMP kinase [Acholeplasmatales bacterium]